MRLIDADALVAAHPRIRSRDMKFNLDLAPTIDPESLRLHAQWEELGIFLTCSNCGHTETIPYSGSFANYCRQCGAKMDLKGGE